MIPGCYDPALQQEAWERKWERRLCRRPECLGCGAPVVTEEYLDLQPFGLGGILCGRCRDRNSHLTRGFDEEG